MTKWRILAAGVLAAAFLASPLAGVAADTNSVPPAKAKPDLLTTCPVSGEKLGEMGKPCVFVYQDQEIKLCCSSCRKDFDKDPAKYVAKIRAADKKAKN
jgi:hypothetical protein